MGKQVNRDSRLIAVVGNTGAGRSSFINAVIGKDVAGVHQESGSCTKKIAEYTYQLPNDSGEVVIIDTPALNAYHHGEGVEMPTASQVLDELIAYVKVLVITTRWDEAPALSSDEMGDSEEIIDGIEQEKRLSSKGLVEYLKSQGIGVSFRRSGKEARAEEYVAPRELVQDLFGCRLIPGGVSMNVLTTELSRAKAELTDRLSFELESSLRSATLASNEALRDAFQIIKQYSTELRELREELDRSRIKLAWKTKELEDMASSLESTKEEVENLKKERAELQVALYMKDEMTKHLMESTKKEVESLKKEQVAMSLLVKDQLEATKGGARDIREDLDRLKQLAITSGGASGKSLVDLRVDICGWTLGFNAEYKAMEKSVFGINQGGLFWLTSRPVWEDGVQVGWIRFIALIEGEKVSLDGLRGTIVRSHQLIYSCDIISILKL
ncbi:hypothetical protein H1R20_g6741, partial [Candolleomyces eurysporus]